MKTSKRFRPYGTSYHLPIKGKAKVAVTCENGASITTWVCVNDDPKEQSLLGKADVRRLGIVHLNPKGAEKEVELDEPVQRVNYSRKSKNKCDIVSGGESQEVIDERMQNLIRKY